MMRPLRVVNALGRLLRLWSLTLLFPIPVGLWFEERDTVLAGLPAVPRSTLVFLAAFLTSAALWGPAILLGRRVREEEMLDREGYLTVALAWLLMALLGMLPFLYSGVLRSPVDAFFESMSGFTGTGSSVILEPLEGVDKAILFWRALSQWIGGLGIIVLFVAFLSGIARGGLQLFQAEAASHIATRLKPKLAETARTLLGLYATVTAVMVALLTPLLLRTPAVAGWDVALFDATAHVFAAYGTGGFSTHTASIAYYDDAWVEGALTLFMLFGGVNFSLVYLLFRERDSRLFRTSEFRFYVGAYAVAMAVNAAILMFARPTEGFGEVTRLGPLAALRHSSFTVASLYTGTGFSTADYAVWPQGSLLILILVMFFGGMAGSTSSAIKSFRWLILLKTVVRELRHMVHPRAILPVRLGTRVIEPGTVSSVAGFFFVYLAVWIAGTLIVVVTDPLLGIVDGTAATASNLGNVGGGLGNVGPSHGYGGLLWSSKLVLTLMMWVGRLEIFPVLLLLIPKIWRN